MLLCFHLLQGRQALGRLHRLLSVSLVSSHFFFSLSTADTVLPHFVPLAIHVLSKFPTLFVSASGVLRITQVLEKRGGQDPIPQGIYILFGGDKQ